MHFHVALPNFCEQCGSPVRGASEVCSHWYEVLTKRMEEENRQKDREKMLPKSYCPESRAIYLSHDMWLTKKNQDGSWERWDMKRGEPALRGSIPSIGMRRSIKYSRDWAYRLMKRIRRSRYVHHDLANKIRKHCDHKYRLMGYTKDAEAGNWEYGHQSSGWFCPIDLKTRSPLQGTECELCGDTASVVVLAEGIELQEVWDRDDFTIYYEDEHGNMRKPPSLCSDEQCNTLRNWMLMSRKDPNSDWWKKARKLRIKTNRKAIYSTPVSFRKAQAAAEYLSFAADAKTKGVL